MAFSIEVSIVDLGNINESNNSHGTNLFIENVQKLVKPAPYWPLLMSCFIHDQRKFIFDSIRGDSFQSIFLKITF